MSKQKTILAFLSNRHKRLLFFAIMISLVIALVSSAMYFFVPPEIPLMYSLARPEQQLINKNGIFILPAIAIVSIVSTLLSLSYVKNIDTVVTTLIMWSQIVIQSLLLVITIRILIIIS